MRKMLTIALMGLLGLSAPAFAQTYNQSPSSGTTVASGKPNTSDTAQAATEGAYAQGAPEDNTNTLLLAGGAILGAGLVGCLLADCFGGKAQAQPRPLSP